MSTGLSSYRKFIYKDDALELIHVLEKNEIDYELEDNSSRLDASFGADDNTAEFVLKIDKNNFSRVEELEEDLVRDSLNMVDEDYYLFEFSDDELIEIVLKKEEWNKFDYLLAQKILKERGKEINPDLLKSINRQRIDDLKTQEASPKWLIYIGYFLSIFGSFIGFFIGLYLKSYKKNLPNGEAVYSYGKEDREQGKNIMICSVIGFVFWIIIGVLRS